MLSNLSSVSRNKSSVFLLVLALIVGGVGAQATGLINTESGGYLVCVNSTTKVVTHPGTSNCPKGSKKLVLGAQGAAGTNGLTGAQGAAGTNGLTGAQGAQGAAGTNGLTGATGLSSRDGTDGKDGKTLWNGVKDPESTWGAPGDMFINSVTKTLFGPKNLDGTWHAGVSMVGPKGDQGLTGLTGAQGPVGATGATGVQGPVGATGVQGPVGATGATGVQGPVGATGATGAAGASGSKITELSICGAGGTSLCKIGAIGPGGGLIFFVDYNDQYAGFNYLEAAPSSCETTRAWSSANTSVPAVAGWAARAVGAGSTNTAAIKAVFTTDTSTNNAAYFASACSAGSKSDWFLGSLGEMKLMYDNLQGLGGFVESLYWSSSEGSAYLAWFQLFSLGFQSSDNKNSAYYVRPVRAF